MMSGNASLYIHLPFCKKRCPYCHFFVVKENERAKDRLLTALIQEWHSIKEKLVPYHVISIYFGGGTPSLFGPQRLEELLGHLPISKNTEITVEGNPDGMDFPLLSSLKKIGINRLSIGVQSLEDHLLFKIGRTHTSYQAFQVLENAEKAGFSNITIDLMYDLPHQTLNDFSSTLKKTTNLPITHLSLYNLILEPGSPFFHKKTLIQPTQPSEHTSLRMLHKAQEVLERQGFLQYEISAFSKPGYESIHNIGYWTGRPFWGLGPSSFSFFDGSRFQNVSNLNKYLHLIQNQQSPITFQDHLSFEDRQKELLIINLRLFQGVNLSSFEDSHGPLPHSTQLAINSLVQEGFLLFKNKQLTLSKKGKVFYDSIAIRLL